MSPNDIVAMYYDAWISKRGDMAEVPLAPDLCGQHRGTSATAYGIMVLTTDGEHIIEITGFADPALFAAFDLAIRLER